MVALSATNAIASKVHTNMQRAQIIALVGENLKVVYPGAFVGVYDGSSSGTRGQLLPYDDSDIGCRFLGVHIGEGGTADGSLQFSAQLDGLTLDRVTVAGSGSSLPGTPIYALTDNPDDLTITKANAGQDIVGNLLTQVTASGTEWSVLLRPGMEALEAALNSERVSKVTAYTVDGVITLPTSDGEAARLTGGSSAVMTVAVPTNAILGYRFTVYRVAGSGTHTVGYDTEAGTSIVHALDKTGESTTLLAVSTTGWRPV